MITGQLRTRIDKLWEEFWTGGITNPLTVIEQISFLMFARLVDMRESTEEKKFDRVNRGQNKKFPGLFFSPKQQEIRWSQFKHLDPDAMLEIVRDKVFRHFRDLGTNGQSEDDPTVTIASSMKDATLMIQKPSLLVSAVSMIDELPLTHGDTKGDLYEYLLSKLTTAGINGQFRTPRHIIRLMVDLVLRGNYKEAMTWTVGDPAVGTGGFLVSFMEALLEHNTSLVGTLSSLMEEDLVAGSNLDVVGRQIEENGSNRLYTGDRITSDQWKHIQHGMFHGFDFDVTMLRIASMNLMLHGIDSPDIHYQDTLSSNFPEKYPELAENAFDLILANPPFKGSLDYSDVHSSLTGKVKTKKTELLFILLILRMLKQGGQCAVVVPDGVLFGSSNAHKSLRQLLVDQHQLEAVVKLPAGVFKPYAGVSTAILFFTKDGRTNDVWFYDVQADGFSLDDKRDPVAENDLPDVRQRWAKRNRKTDTDRTAKAFFVPKKEIVENGYDLSLNRYKEIVHEEMTYDPPQTILVRLKALEAEIASDLEELEAMLG